MDKDQVENACHKNTRCRADEYEAKWFFIPLALGFFSALFGTLVVLYFLSSQERQKALVQCVVAGVTVRHAEQQTLNTSNFFVSSQKVASN